MVRNRPQLVPALLRGVFGLDVSGDVRVTLASESYAGTHPAELRCDATVLLDDPDAPSLGVVVESQLRARKDKTFSWPAYLALLRLRRRCPVTLLVLCPDWATAQECAAPIAMGHPDWVLKLLTVHPEMLPAITDPAVARGLPELAVLSAPAHADGGPHARAGKHSGPCICGRWLCQVSMGMGGIHGVPRIASRSTVMASRPCLVAVEM
jgi:hypothetical protein